MGNLLQITQSAEKSTWYPAFRNTLITLIGLFAVYLVFEFATLWKHDFPTGFYYAGYAHKGAAWLTFALALATAFLSLIFRNSMLSDPRLGRVRRLAWVWSGLNLLLAVAVYNRLLIYVGYNGMTRMRTVGFFGITLVVIGFCLVLCKIAPTKNGSYRSFWWLIRAQLIALLLTVIAYSVFPVDYIANRYNVSRVQAGYLHPSVMIAVKPISDEGVFSAVESRRYRRRNDSGGRPRIYWRSVKLIFKLDLKPIGRNFNGLAIGFRLPCRKISRNGKSTKMPRSVTEQ